MGRCYTTLAERIKEGLGYFQNRMFNKKQIDLIKSGYIHEILPTLRILKEVPLELLNKAEADCIREYSAIEDGYNLINGSDYVEYKLASKNRTLKDNKASIYQDITILDTNPAKYVGHTTIVDTTVYNHILKKYNLYIQENTPDDTKLKSFEIRVKYEGKNITLAKLIAADILGLNPSTDYIPRIYHKNKNRRNNRLSNLYINGQSLLSIAKEKGLLYLIA